MSQDVFSALVNVGEIGNTGIDVQALFSAFEANNLGEILASPTIKVMDGQQGRIQVGQDFSIKQRDIAGNVVEKFFNVGTILTVTPQVITQRDTTFIHLDIDAERSSAQPDPVSTIINKQQAQTQAILLDGETTVIAGLYNKEKTEVRRGVPILKDLPPWFFGLRYLFGYSSKDVQTRELVILLQASLTPSIPDRYGDEFKNKYQVLQDEREEMRRELKQSDRALQGKELNKNKRTANSDSSQEDGTNSDQMANEEPPAKEKQQDMEQDSSASQEMNTEDQQENESPAVADPEVQPEKVELNLGGNRQDSTSGQEAQEIDTASNQTTAEDTAEQAQTAVEQPSQSYYLIGGSFEVEKNAVDMRDELQDQGFNAAIITMNDSDIMLVAYQGFDDLGEAKSGLANIKETENTEAWLYKAQ